MNTVNAIINDVKIKDLSAPAHIIKAADGHRELNKCPEPLRSTRKAIVTATATAMMQIEASYSKDIPKKSAAEQAVDEAMLHHGFAIHRTVPVNLGKNIDEDHFFAAYGLKGSPIAIMAGYANAKSVARVDRATSRTVRTRSPKYDPHSSPAHDEAVFVAIIGIILKTVRDRCQSIIAIKDDALLGMVEDAFDMISAQNERK